MKAKNLVSKAKQPTKTTHHTCKICRDPYAEIGFKTFHICEDCVQYIKKIE